LSAAIAEEAAAPATAAHARLALVAARSMEEVLGSLDPAARIASVRPERFGDTRADTAARHATRGAAALIARATAKTACRRRAASVSYESRPRQFAGDAHGFDEDRFSPKLSQSPRRDFEDQDADHLDPLGRRSAR